MKYILSKHIDQKSFETLIDDMLSFVENYVDIKHTWDCFCIIGTIVALIKGIDKKHKWMFNARLVDTQEREKYWRIQIQIDTYLTGLSTYLLQINSLKRSKNILYLKEKGKCPYITIWNGELILTAIIKKTNEIQGL